MKTELMLEKKRVEKMNDRNTIRVSKELNFFKGGFTKLELDFAYSFITQIKDTDEELMDYKVSLKDLEEKMGKRLQDKDIEYIFDSLSKKEFKVKNEKEIAVYTFFTYLHYSKKDKTLTVDFNKRLKPHLLNLKSYASGNLKYVLSFRSEYTKRMYMLCKQWLKATKVTLSVDDIREMFEVPNYTFYDIKRRIIEKSQQELIDKKADVNFEWDEKDDVKKVGNKITHITLRIYKYSKPKKAVVADDFSMYMKKIIYHMSEYRRIIDVQKSTTKDYVVVQLLDDSFSVIVDEFHLSKLKAMIDAVPSDKR